MQRSLGTYGPKEGAQNLRRFATSIAQEFSSSAGSGTTWGVDQAGTLANGSSTTMTYPSLSPTSTAELYYGYADGEGGAGSAGSTSGFTYDATAGGNEVAYDTNVSSPSAYQPTAPQGAAGASLAIGATFTATGSGGGGGGGCPTGSGSGSGPIVTSVSPCTGSTSGGTSVTITGSNFTGVTGVKFGTTPASSYTVTSSTSITAVAPAGSTGAVDVTVTTGGMRLEELAAYSAYGIQTIQSGADVTPFGFQGSYTDPSGLIYLIGRYYDPTTDQFLSVDPLVAFTGQPYAFTGDDPLNVTDPLGEFFTCGGQPGSCAGSPSTGPILIPPPAAPPSSSGTKSAPAGSGAKSGSGSSKSGSKSAQPATTYSATGGESQSDYYQENKDAGPPPSDQYYGNNGPGAPTPEAAKEIAAECTAVKNAELAGIEGGSLTALGGTALSRASQFFKGPLSDEELEAIGADSLADSADSFGLSLLAGGASLGTVGLL